jgi:hypothetical protein
MEWIGLASLVLTAVLAIHVSNQRSTRDLKITIEKLFVARIDRIDEDDKLRDEWIQEIENKATVTSGEVQVLKSRMDTVERVCDRRHEMRPFPGGAL